MQKFLMVKTEELSSKEQRFVENLCESLKKSGAGFSRLRMVHLTGIAIQTMHTGTRREDKLVNAMARGLSVRERMATEEGGNLSADEAARQLGVTKQSVLNLYHAGKVLAWRTEKQGALRFPIWQFTQNHRLPGLEEVLAKLNAGKVLDDWGKIGFFLQTHGILDGRRPLDMLRENKLDPVLKAAETYVE
jgi:hypothetical protein